MPATSRSGEVFSRRSASVALRLALEVDDHHVVLGDQHLAEMVVAVDAGLEAGRRRCRAALRGARTSRRALSSSAATSSPRLLRQRRHAPARARRSARFAVARSQRRPSGSTSSLRDRLGGEGRIVGRRRERRVQLGGAPAERRGQVERIGEGRRGVGAAPSLASRGSSANSSRCALERVEHDAPGVALVAHEGEGGGERGRLAVVRHDTRRCRRRPACSGSRRPRSGSAPPRSPAAARRGAAGRSSASPRRRRSTETLLCSAPTAWIVARRHRARGTPRSPRSGACRRAAGWSLAACASRATRSRTKRSS